MTLAHTHLNTAYHNCSSVLITLLSVIGKSEMLFQQIRRSRNEFSSFALFSSLLTRGIQRLKAKKKIIFQWNCQKIAPSNEKTRNKSHRSKAWWRMRNLRLMSLSMLFFSRDFLQVKVIDATEFLSRRVAENNEGGTRSDIVDRFNEITDGDRHERERRTPFTRLVDKRSERETRRTICPLCRSASFTICWKWKIGGCFHFDVTNEQIDRSIDNCLTAFQRFRCR